VNGPALRIHQLTHRYGSFVAVKALDLEVRRGEILGFLGPNGAGKTTTLRCCAGLLAAAAGAIEIAGVSLAADPLGARARLGFVPDRPFFYERLSAREFLDFIAAIYDVSPQVAGPRADVLLRRLELEEAADDLIETYSHGMRQKVSLAAALLHEPPLLMLDEPLTGLDPIGARTMKDVLRESAGQGHGVLVSTHLLDVAERLCDRVVILHHGEKRAEGSLAELRGAGSSATLEDVFLAMTRDGVTPA